MIKWAPSSEFVSSSIPSWQILTAHAQPFRRARDLAFCLKVPLDSLLVRASSEGSGETARMRRLGWTFAARTGDKYQIRLTRSSWFCVFAMVHKLSCGAIMRTERFVFFLSIFVLFYLFIIIFIKIYIGTQGEVCRQLKISLPPPPPPSPSLFSPVVYATNRSKAVVPVLFLFCLALWFILRGVSCFKVFPGSLSSCFFFLF